MLELEVLPTGTRADGRLLEETRPLRLSFPAQRGLVEARRGGTLVVAKASYEVVEPRPERPNAGSLVVRAAVPRGLQETREHGKLRSIIDQIFAGSSVVLLDTLCLVPGRAVLSLTVDLEVVGDDGAVVDCCAAAAAAALLHLPVPVASMEDGVPRVWPVSERPGAVNVRHIPVCVSLAQYSLATLEAARIKGVSDLVDDSGSLWLPDPCKAELQLADGTMALCFDKSGILTGIYKYSGCGLPVEELERLSVLATRLAEGVGVELEASVREDVRRREEAELRRLRGF